MTDYHISDRMQSALAMTHHVQNRIIQCLSRGEVSDNVAADIARQCQAIAETFARAAKP